MEVRILWRNSKSLSEARSDSQNELLLSLTPGIHSGLPESWSPRDFYDNVHVPDSTSETPNIMQAYEIECQLYPFQKRAVQWLLMREGVDLPGKSENAEQSDEDESSLPHGFFRAKDAQGRDCLVNHWLGIVTTDEKILEGESQLRGGILAEEMGLGKTVEILALISLHKRSVDPNCALPTQDVRPSSRATLIITPPSILQQWNAEIRRLAPSFTLLIYDGIRNLSSEEDNDETLTRLINHDIVLTTYNVLASEIYYSGVTPDRSLRHEKKYERRQSPLVQIDWWRVVLDECQMVESGVSNAAKVARLIPRINAWAVSGTPLKKDAKDLLGLLIFLRYRPYCYSTQIWQRLVTRHKPVLKQLFKAIALRHTKELVKGDIQLPPQKRVVLTIPFTQVEEQHYANLYQQMCEECGLDIEGAPLMDTWDPKSPSVIEKMRTWLTRLRQTCLHPEVGDRNRRALGHGNGPLRTVGEVLQVMIEQNDTASRADERLLLLSQLRRGQILEHAEHSQEALQIWLKTLDHSRLIVKDCRQQLLVETQAAGPFGGSPQLVNGQESDGGSTNRTGLLRLRLRSALEIEHVSTFFVANAYYQLKTDEQLTSANSAQFQELERAETETYEKAKLLRKEMLTETYAKAEAFMSIIRSRAQDRSYVTIPNFTPFKFSGGIESRNILSRLEELADLLNRQAEQLDEWREKMIQLLTVPLVDQDEDDLQGDEYEISTRQQEEVYVYLEALRALVADRHDALSGQSNELIKHETAFALERAKEGAGHSPDLLRQLLAVRSGLKPGEGLGSIRGIVTELRVLKTAQNASSRANTEAAIMGNVLQILQNDATKQAKAVSGLERELDIYRDTMNARLEYYRQLQAISDAVAPYEEDLSEDTLRTILEEMKGTEVKLQAKIDTLKARGRYLLHLRDESAAENTQRMCIICQQPFEVGALTSCGHSYCKECLRIWWNTHRNCPTCKKHLSRNDFHQISYKPLKLSMQEEIPTKMSEVESIVKATSIYSGINKATLNQIQNIDVEGSFGTKVDTLARHLLWIRDNDPGAKSIVFSQFKDFLDVLARAFSRFKIGFTSIDKKDGVEKFKKDPSVGIPPPNVVKSRIVLIGSQVECFFLHAKAHSSGLNLVNATHVFLCEPLINTAIELQAIARVHRIGQHHPTAVWMYLVEDTVEKAIYDIS
ncbi:MAG: hypothetical protein Q9187_003907, partial [Circinaria calcarea]